MPAVNLGMPKVPETLAPRRKTRQIKVDEERAKREQSQIAGEQAATPSEVLDAELVDPQPRPEKRDQA